MLFNIFTEAEFELLGKFLIILIFVFIIIVFFSLIILVRFMKKKGSVPPNLLLYLIQILYGPLSVVADLFSIEPDTIDKIFLKLNNSVTYGDLAKIDPRDRLILLPQCMRSIDCPAKLSSVDGFKCKECGKCQIGAIKSLCDSLNMKLFIVPGGSFAKRIMKVHRPKAVIGVACFNELYEGIVNASLFELPSMGVSLTKTGCVETELDYNDLLHVLLAGIDEDIKMKVYEEFGCPYTQS
ncbi:MAG: hypothetical protein SYNGOMJ08_00369 [Candidatus Syntrophoarchaeum sp. GoM_oil]|nr:MAG: hypothetical protein SYNGOMJ08_00369 [Candidatus Syntrophoarchaeum sp. GoM_oil]